MTRLAIVVGSRGRGSNMAAIARACSNGEIEATVALVLAPTDESPALQAALELGLTVATLDPANLVAQLLGGGVDLVCLAGFMRLLPMEVIEAFPDRILNIHPALLPKFGGKGMYGLHVHRAVLESGDHESGCTVHFVNEEYDKGEIILQRRCPVLPGDTPESLAARVLFEEHEAYPQAIRQVIQRE